MTADDPRTTEILEAAVKDTNRALSKKNTGRGYFEVVSLEIAWLTYDPALDDLVRSTKTITYVP